MACGKRVEEEQEFERTIKLCEGRFFKDENGTITLISEKEYRELLAKLTLLNVPINYHGDIEGVQLPVWIDPELANAIDRANKEKQLPKGNIKNAGETAKLKLKRDNNGKNRKIQRS